MRFGGRAAGDGKERLERMILVIDVGRLGNPLESFVKVIFLFIGICSAKHNICLLLPLVLTPHFFFLPARQKETARARLLQEVLERLAEW